MAIILKKNQKHELKTEVNKIIYTLNYRKSHTLCIVKKNNLVLINIPFQLFKNQNFSEKKITLFVLNDCKNILNKTLNTFQQIIFVLKFKNKKKKLNLARLPILKNIEAKIDVSLSRTLAFVKII